MGAAIETMSDIDLEDRLGFELGVQLNTQGKRDRYVRHVHQKWDTKGWLNSEKAERAGFPKLRNRHVEENMALILENQLRFQKGKEKRIPVYFDQKTQQPYITMMNDTSTADESLPTVAVMPIIRRVYAQVMNSDFSTVQPMAGPTSYVFFLDFLRESDSSNLLSVEYNANLTPELGVPPKGKLRLNSTQIRAVKQMLGVTWSTESEEDAQAILGLNVETELMKAFTTEFARDLISRHLQTVNTGSTAGVATGQNLPAPQGLANVMTTIPARGALSYTDYKSAIYNALIDADVLFQRANKRPSTAIIAGLALAGFLRKMLTATGSSSPDQANMSSVGISNYGNYAEHWTIWGTEFLPDNAGFLYLKDPDPLMAGHIYAPYVPITATPRIYADYDPVTGNFQNKDAWTRNIRERSAEILVKPYAFIPIQGPTPLSF